MQATYARAVAQPIHTFIRMHSHTKLDSAGPLTTSKRRAPGSSGRQCCLHLTPAGKCAKVTLFLQRECWYVIIYLGCEDWVFPPLECTSLLLAREAHEAWSVWSCTREACEACTHIHAHTHIHTQFESTTGGQWGGRWGVQIVGETNRHQVCVCVRVYGIWARKGWYVLRTEFTMHCIIETGIHKN